MVSLLPEGRGRHRAWGPRMREGETPAEPGTHGAVALRVTDGTPCGRARLPPSPGLWEGEAPAEPGVPRALGGRGSCRARGTPGFGRARLLPSPGHPLQPRAPRARQEPRP